MDATKVTELKLFIEQCKKNPTILTNPSISFFRDYLESLGTKLPPVAYRPGESPQTQDAICYHAQREEKENGMAKLRSKGRITSEEPQERVFSRLRPYCVDLLELVWNPKKNTSFIQEMTGFLCHVPPDALQPCLE